MNYQEALAYIHGTYKFGSKLGLENISYLLELLGNPHRDLKVIHVAGTNGKGSTSAFLHGILKAGGYRTGLYTSPYLQHFTERIQINGVPISEEDLARWTEVVKVKIDQMVAEGKNHPTEFEVVTALAFCYYQEAKVDYLVLEVGLGGRLDATNVVPTPLASVITPIGLDHTQYLGDTLEQVAFEKGGIIKPGGLTIIHPQEPQVKQVFERLCQERENQLMIASHDSLRVLKSDITGQTFGVKILEQDYPEARITMLGRHQVHNCITALYTIEALRQRGHINISQEAILEGIHTTHWPGRMEVMGHDPLTIIDGAHNPHGALALRASMETLLKDRPITLVVGMLEDKDIDSYLEIILPLVDQVVTTAPDNPRALAAEALAERVQKYGKPVVPEEGILAAVQKGYAMTPPQGALIFSGSLYLIGEVRKILGDLKKE